MGLPTRVVIPQNVIEKFNEDHFDSIVSAGFYVEDGTPITEELMIEALLQIRKLNAEHGVVDNPPRTNKLKRFL